MIVSENLERPIEVVEQIAKREEMLTHASSHDNAVVSHSKKSTISKIRDRLFDLAPPFIVEGMRGMLKYILFEKFVEFMEYLSTHPVFALPLFTLIVFVGFPIFTFVILALVSTVVTCFGFLMIEGALIGMGALVAGGFVVTIFGFVFVVLLSISVSVFCLQKIRIL